MTSPKAMAELLRHEASLWFATEPVVPILQDAADMIDSLASSQDARVSVEDVARALEPVMVSDLDFLADQMPLGGRGQFWLDVIGKWKRALNPVQGEHKSDGDSASCRDELNTDDKGRPIGSGCGSESPKGGPSDTVLVPREPTEEMLCACNCLSIRAKYKAMIAAAPAHPLVTRQWHKDVQELWTALEGGPTPRCRDCADSDGTCLADKMPCNPQERALERIKRLRVTRQEIERGTIERCAKVAEKWLESAWCDEVFAARSIASAIRSLSEGMGSKDDVQKETPLAKDNRG